jgi:hypothetical protein
VTTHGRLWNSPHAIACSTLTLLAGARATVGAGSSYCPSAGWLVEYAVEFNNSDQLTGTIEAGVPGKRDGRVVVAEDFDFGTAGMFAVLYPTVRLTVAAGVAACDISLNFLPLEADDSAVAGLPYILQGNTLLTIGAGATTLVPVPIGATAYQVLPANQAIDVLQTGLGGVTREEYSIESSTVALATAGAQATGWHPTLQATTNRDISVTNVGAAPITTTVLFQFDMRSGFGS